MFRSVWNQMKKIESDLETWCFMLTRRLVKILVELFFIMKLFIRPMIMAKGTVLFSLVSFRIFESDTSMTVYELIKESLMVWQNEESWKESKRILVGCWCLVPWEKWLLTAWTTFMKDLFNTRRTDVFLQRFIKFSDVLCFWKRIKNGF